MKPSAHPLRCVALLALLLAGPTLLRAQQPWFFATLEEACMDDAYLVTPPAELRRQVEQAAMGAVVYNVSYHLSGPYTSLGRRYVRFQNQEADFRLPEAKAALLLPYLVSHSFWRARYEQLAQWAYIDMEQLTGLLVADTASRTYGRYTTCVWLGYAFQPSVEAPVCFSVSLGGGEPQPLTLRALERLAEWGAFATRSDWQAYMAQNADLQRRQAEHEAALQRQIDSLSALLLHVEQLSDSILVAMRSDSLAYEAEQSRLEIERTKEHMNRNEIFLLSVNPARSDYMFGLELNLYNCFQKTISMIEITVTPYNDRTRVQEDRFGRSVRTVRCMGPIRPGAPAQYTFDELFWAEDNNIKFMRLTNLTFHFTDGSTRHYTGYNPIMRHCLKR